MNQRISKSKKSISVQEKNNNIKGKGEKMSESEKGGVFCSVRMYIH